MTLYTHKPGIELEFILEDGRHFVANDAVSYTSTRSLDNPTARATIQFRGVTWQDVSDPALVGKSISDTLSFYDICRVWMYDGKGKRWLDLYGFVQGDNPAILENNGVPEKHTVVNLVGLGEALVKYQIFWHPHIAGQSNLGGLGWLARSKGKVPKGRPHEVLQSLYDTFLNDKYIFTLANDRKISQVLHTRFASIPDSLCTMGLSALGNEGALWETLKRYSDAPWNELFVDIEQEYNNPVTQHLLGQKSTPNYAEKVGVYLRPTPFGASDWVALAREGSGWGFLYEEDERMGGGEMLGKDANDIYNFFWCPAKAVYSGFDQLSMAYKQSGGELPVYSEDSIRKYGLRRLEQGTEYVQPITSDDAKQGTLDGAKKNRASTKAAKITDLLVKRTRQLQRWFGYDRFYKGTITTRGRIGTDYSHGARIGSVLTRKRDGRQFYVTGISQNWSMPGPHTTTWTVTRGHDPAAYKTWWEKTYGKAVVLINKGLVSSFGIG